MRRHLGTVARLVVAGGVGRLLLTTVSITREVGGSQQCEDDLTGPCPLSGGGGGGPGHAHPGLGVHGGLLQLQAAQPAPGAVARAGRLHPRQTAGRGTQHWSHGYTDCIVAGISVEVQGNSSSVLVILEA